MTDAMTGDLDQLQRASWGLVAAWLLGLPPEDEVPACTCAHGEHTYAARGAAIQAEIGEAYVDSLEDFASKAAQQIHDMLFPGNALPAGATERVALFVCTAFFAGWAGALKAAASELPENVIPFPSAEQEG